jgi:hypothetical protein
MGVMHLIAVCLFDLARCSLRETSFDRQRLKITAILGQLTVLDERTHTRTSWTTND